MMNLSAELHSALAATVNHPRTLVEIYADGGTLYYSDQALTWGGHSYGARVIDRGTISRSMTEIDTVTVRLANVDRALNAYPSSALRGRRIIIRQIDTTVAADSVVLFHGLIRAASARNEMERTIEAVTLLGGYDQEIPGRIFHLECAWPFKGEECGYAGAQTTCDRSWARCSALANTARFGGFRFTPHSGVYSYQVETMKRVWLIFLRRKKETKVASWAAVDDTPQGVAIPIVLGRVHLAGMPIQHADEGGVTTALIAFCAGPIHSIEYIRANDTLVADSDVHIGQYGGQGSQTIDSRFPGGYQYNLLAYAGVDIPSDVSTVDSAPTVTAVVAGAQVKVYNSGGFVALQWSDNPIWNTQHVMHLPLHQGGMGIAEEWFDLARNAVEAAYCDELVSDDTGDQKIYTPETVAEPGEQYRRYQSTGVDGIAVDEDGPYSEYGPSDNDTQAPVAVNSKRFTLNIAIVQQERAVDVITRRLLPCFRGFVTYSQEGKIQIRVERPDRHTTLASSAAAGATTLVAEDGGYLADGDVLLVGPGTANAECVTVSSVVGDNVTLANPTSLSHTAGVAIYRVVMHIGPSRRTGPVQETIEDKDCNRVVVNYIDSPSGFQSRAVHCNDYESQAAIRRIAPETIDAQGVDSYFQAWRIGQFELARRGRLASGYRVTMDISGTPLEVGDVVALDDDAIGVVPIVVTKIGYRPDYEVEVEGRLYDPTAYPDSAARATVPVLSLPSLEGQVELTEGLEYI